MLSTNLFSFAQKHEWPRCSPLLMTSLLLLLLLLPPPCLSSPSPSSAAVLHDAECLWRQGATGAGIRVAVLDSGLGDERDVQQAHGDSWWQPWRHDDSGDDGFDEGSYEDHGPNFYYRDTPAPSRHFTAMGGHFRRVAGRTDWTTDLDPSDGLGHGTHVAGVVAGSHPSCPGMAPDAEILSYKVFGGGRDQISYTAWMIDALNHALASGAHVVNLSVGGPDSLDEPFTDKVRELVANGIIVVSAAGNDGPLWGTLHSPADMPEVIAVGGAAPSTGGPVLESYSSRGIPMMRGGTSSFSATSGGVRAASSDVPYSRTNGDRQVSSSGGGSSSIGAVKPDVLAFSSGISAAWPAREPGQRQRGGRISSRDRCHRLSGTSVASPVIAGTVALLASLIPEHERWPAVNAASIRQALVESASPLQAGSMYEQGAGLVNLTRAASALRRIIRNPIPTFHPSSLDLTPETGCPYTTPWCLQPLYAGGTAVAFNVTLLNPAGRRSRIVGHPAWRASSKTTTVGTSRRGGDTSAKFEPLSVRVASPGLIWPWVGQVAIEITVDPRAAQWDGVVEGVLAVEVETVVEVAASMKSASSSSSGGGSGGEPLAKDFDSPRRVVTHTVEIKVKARVVPTPPRHRRVLWDIHKSRSFPEGYYPVDELSELDQDGQRHSSSGADGISGTKSAPGTAAKSDPSEPRRRSTAGHFDRFDWHGDSPFGNHLAAYRELRAAGYFVDILRRSLFCFDAAKYGVLLLVDPEAAFTVGEAEKLRVDVADYGLSVVVFADWYESPGPPSLSMRVSGGLGAGRSLPTRHGEGGNGGGAGGGGAQVMPALRFWDDNTQSWWHPVTGGANVPAINGLLAPFGISFGQAVWDGTLHWPHGDVAKTTVASGAAITSFPAGGILLDGGAQQLQQVRVQLTSHQPPLVAHQKNPVMLGLVESGEPIGGGIVSPGAQRPRSRIAVYGDSSCLDGGGGGHASATAKCGWLLKELVAYATTGAVPRSLGPAPVRRAFPFRVPTTVDVAPAPFLLEDDNGHDRVCE